MCGIRNPRTAHDARTTKDLRITAGGHFLVVIVVIPHSRITRPRHKNNRSRFFFYFTAMRVKKFLDLFHKSLYQVVSKNDITHSYFLMNSIREKATLACGLSSRQHPE